MMGRLRRFFESVLVFYVELAGYPVRKHLGKVLEIDVPDNPDSIEIMFTNGDESYCRVLPKKMVEAVGAAFETAQVEYRIYEVGAVRLLVLRYVGPTREQLLSQPICSLTEEQIRELDGE